MTPPDGSDHAGSVFQYVLENSSLLLVVLDRDGHIADCNQGFLRLIESETKPVGHTLLEYLAPDSRIFFSRWFQNPHNRIRLEFVSGPGNVTEYECVLQKKTETALFFGEHRAITASDIISQMSVLNNQLANATRELHQKNRELQKAHRMAEDANRAKTEVLAHLEELVVTRTAELEKATVAAESANRAKSTFLSNMSHELRTPMNAIMGFTYLLKNDPLTPKQMDQVNRISAAAQQLMQLINDILDFSRIEDTSMNREMQDFAPENIIDQVRGAFWDKVAAKNLDMVVDLDTVPDVLRGDGEAFARILNNLVGNAVKFTEKGRISIAMRVVDEMDDGIVLRCEVRDTGIGMGNDQLKNLFQAFEQGDGSKTRRFGGTGIGLAISKLLVDRMNGRIGVESEMGQGSLFWLEIPFQKPDKAPEPIEMVIPAQPVCSPDSESYAGMDEVRACEKPDDNRTVAVDWAVLTDVLNQLEALLADDNTAVNDAFASSRELLEGVLGDSARKLDRQIQNFDYSDALTTLLDIRQSMPAS